MLWWTDTERENLSAWSRNCSSATLYNKNPTRAGLGLNPGHRVVRSANNRIMAWHCPFSKAVNLCSALNVYTHTHTRARAHTHARTHTHKHTHKHIHTNTHTQYLILFIVNSSMKYSVVLKPCKLKRNGAWTWIWIKQNTYVLRKRTVILN